MSLRREPLIQSCCNISQCDVSSLGNRIQVVIRALHGFEQTTEQTTLRASRSHSYKVLERRPCTEDRLIRLIPRCLVVLWCFHESDVRFSSLLCADLTTRHHLLDYVACLLVLPLECLLHQNVVATHLQEDLTIQMPNGVHMGDG